MEASSFLTPEDRASLVVAAQNPADPLRFVHEQVVKHIHAAVQAERETTLQKLQEILERPPSENSLTADSSEADWYKGFLGGWNDALVEAEQAIRVRGEEEG